MHPRPPATRPLDITGHTRVFLILGDPVVQVRAPELFNALFRRHGVDAVLVPAQVAAADLQGFVLQVLKAGNIDGLWLTIPHKGQVLPLLDRIDRLGQVAQAVNAVRCNADGTLEGALFDGIGFVKALAAWGVPVAGQRALVVGVGGAGLAIATSLAEQGVAELALFDRVPTRAEPVAQRLRAAWPVAVRQATSADPAGFDLVVNATPLGLRADDPLPFDVSRIDGDAAVVDILMKRQPTPLLLACRARGLRAWPGLQMMLRQAPDYLSFFGLPALAQAYDADEAAAWLQAD